MASSVRFVANQAGITALALGPGAQAAVLDKAEKAKAAAVALAEEFRQTGHYADSFEVTATTVVIRGKPRAGARLENTARYATVVEIGRKGAEGHHVIARALDTLRG